MVKTHRDFNGISCMRKLGSLPILHYVRQNHHPLQQPLEAILGDADSMNKNAQTVYELFDSDKNPKRADDLHHLALINDLASEKGLTQMRLACGDYDLLHLLEEDNLTPHLLASRLKQDHPHVFDHAYAMLQIDYVEGWHIYPAKDISPLKENLDDAKTGFKDTMLEQLKRSAYGQQFQVDTYPSQNRLILDVRYAGPLVRDENFDDDGHVQAQSIRKPMEVGLVYYEATGVLKVKTPRGQDALNQAVYQAFAFNYLQNPQALLTLKDTLVINLEELKTREEFPTDTTDSIRNVSLTGLRFRECTGSRETVLVHSRGRAVWDILDGWGVQRNNIEMLGVNLRFEFDQKGNGRFRTVELTAKNIVKLNNSAKDDIIAGYLKRWGIMNV